MRLALAVALLSSALLDGTPGRAVNAPRKVESEELGRYLAGCALGEGESITLDVGGKKKVFRGQFGFAADFWSGTPSVEEQRWMTACLAARTNLWGERVLVALRGPHPGSKSATTPAGELTVQEGAFFGNLFGSPARAFACTGEHEADASPDLARRVCSEPEGSSTRTRCGFAYAGRCADVCELDRATGAYLRCRGRGEIYDEVLTVYLARHRD